jgi:UDP-2,3-diacylglucosamine pyrophosphatase LpxH
MIIFVSDLHLADTYRPTIRLDVFFREIQRRITLAAECGVKSIQLVLLGDIFEILKSKQWLTDKRRPWEKSSPDHQHTVQCIFEGIIDNNSLFFDGLNNLATNSQPPVRVSYIPGNHDRPLKTHMGATAKTRLENLVPEVEWEAYFNRSFFDPEHKLIAKHGHEWDPLNRYVGPSAAIGDAIVIDLLLNFSVLFTEKLNLHESNPEVEFLYELDNVRPQNGRVLAQWLSKGLDKLVQTYPRARIAFEEVCVTLFENFRTLKTSAKTQGIEFEHFTHAERFIKIFSMVASSLGVLPAAEMVPSVGDENTILGELAVNELSNFQRNDIDCKYVISGHTHKPTLIPLNSNECGNIGTSLYLNTGTWRRVHSAGSTVTSRRSCFATWDEECVITVYSEQEQNALRLPAYEFSRLSRGSNV